MHVMTAADKVRIFVQVVINTVRVYMQGVNVTSGCQ